MIEVEVKLKLESGENLIPNLLSKGYEEGDIVYEKDLYYTSEFHDCKERDEALRVRKTVNRNTGEHVSYLTFKGAKMDSISMTRKELETVIENDIIMGSILESLEFHAMTPVEKIRRHYVKGNITACVDTVTDLGDYLELEVLVEDKKQKEAALETIKEELASLGYSMENTTRRSYLSMLENFI